MKTPLPISRSLDGVYLILLGMGCVAAGWLLAAFQVPWFVWCGTLGVMGHLARAKSDAIVLASAWVVLLMFIAAVTKAWTPAWYSNLPWENARLWARGLLLIWLGATGLVLLLAFAPSKLQSIDWSTPRTSTCLLIFTWITLLLGGFLY